MNKWWWLFLFILFWTGAGFAIFGVKQNQDLGNTCLPIHAERIVSAAPNLTEILFALGLEEKIVGVTAHCNYPPAAAKKTKIGTFWQPDIEAVIAAKPDLVITVGFEQQKNLAERLNRLGYKTLTVNIEKISDLFEAIKKIGIATGREYDANIMVRSIKNRLDEMAALIGTKDKVSVLWVVQREPLRVAGRDTFINEIIELAGGENAMGPTVYKYPPIGAEQVIACKPDVIIQPTMGQENLAEQQEKALRYWRRFSGAPAVKDGRIYVINGDIVSRLGPRLPEAAETIAGCLRPKLFKN